jgi:hypothetical protein
MSALTKLARGEPCLVRSPICNGNPETTVAAHYRSISLGAGVGIKPHDLFTAHACSSCHDFIDGRVSVPGYSRDTVRQYHAEGVLRTIDKLIRLGKVKA